MRQRVLSQAVEQRQHDELVERADDIGTARLLSLLLLVFFYPGQGDNFSPKKKKNLHFS